MSNTSDHPETPTSRSAPYTELFSIAARYGRDLSVITEIMVFLDVHPLLIGLPRIIEGLMSALNEMEKAQLLGIGNYDLRSWRDECRWILANRNNPVFTSKLGPLFHSGDERRERNPLIGRGVREYAFPYATLWHEPADVEAASAYYRFVGQLLTAYQKSAAKEKLLEQRYRAYLELRLLCTLQILSIPSDLNIWSNPSSFAHASQIFDAGSSIDLHAAYFPPIARLVRYFGGDVPRESHGGGNHHGRRISNAAGLGVLISQGVTEFPLEDPEDPDLLPGYISFITTPPLINDFDEVPPPGEITTESELCLIDTGGEIRPYVAELLSHQGLLAHIARERQFLPFGYHLLTQFELANLLFGVTDEFLICRERVRSGPKQEQTQNRRRMEALLALHLMLWFGRSLGDCKKLRIAERNSRPTTVLELVRAEEEGVAEFRFFAPTPDYAAEEQLPREAVRDTQEAIAVPDLVGAASLVMALQEISGTPGSAVFTCKTEEVKCEVRTLLKELGRGDPRYTIHKIRSYLHRQIIADSHDVVAATILSGMACLSANTPLFYTQYRVDYLRSVYCRSVQNVLAAVYATAGLEAPISEVVNAQHAAIGARNCLRMDAVKANLEALLLVLRKRPRTGLKQLVHWHNCLSLWTVQMFLMATGCRAIRNPLKQVEEFELRGGQGALGDKGADDGHMSRLVVLPDLLRRQLHAYKTHCVAICALLEPHLHLQTHPTAGFFLRLAEGDCIYFDEIRPLHVSTVMHQVEGFTPHPVNGFRKLLRTELAERGCPPETLSAFMGHWLSGEEPQHAYSSFCPRTYVQNLHLYMLPLMRELGWTLRNSHLVAGTGE